MSDQIILRFLNAGLINVGGDDAKLAKLHETSADLAAVLKKSPSKTAPFALIAFDPEAPTEDPVIKEAAGALQKRWPTYVNTFSGTPIAVLRAVLLDALVQAAAETDKVGVAFVTSARNALPFMEAGNERAIWAEVVVDIERRVDARAEAEWSTPDAIVVPAMIFSPPEAIEVTINPPAAIDKAALAQKFAAAAGPHSMTGATGGNPHWPNQNQQWTSEFANRLAAAVAEAIGVGAKAPKISPVDIAAPLKELAQAVSAHVDATLQAVSGATAGLQRRTSLIWWKEALYSPSASISYRALPASTAAALMAFDLHTQVPTFSPASVAAFLHETVLSLPSLKVDQSRPIRDLLAEVLSSGELTPLRHAAAAMVPEPIGRGPLLGLIGHGAAESAIDDQAFRRLVGVPPAATLKVAEWATWLFRELQAARAAQQGIEVKKKGRKT